MQNTIVKEFQDNPDIEVFVLNEGGSNNETFEWLQYFWDNYYLRGRVVFDPDGSVSLTHYDQPSTGLPFGRGFIIDRDGSVHLPYFGHDPEFVIAELYALLGTSPTPTPTRPPGEPTNTPHPTSTPTCEDLGVKLWMPSTYFKAGDPCACKVIVCNPNSQTYSDVPLFVILDVYGLYFFAPSFVEFDQYTVNVSPGTQEIVVLPQFDWPTGAGSAQDIIWYAAMTNAQITDLFGDLDMWTFGWGN